MTTTLTSRKELSVDMRDRKAASIYKKLALHNPDLPMTIIEDHVAEEMARQGYNLTTRAGVHGVLVRRGIIREG